MNAHKRHPMVVSRGDDHGLLPQILTARNRILALDGWPIFPTVTVEVASKWYGIYLATPVDEASGMCEIAEWDFGVLEPFRCPGSGSYFVDHVPNPNAVRQFCAAKDYELDDLGFELIVGRWLTEVEGKYR